MWVRLLVCVLLVMPMSARAAELRTSSAGDRFEKKIRPLLANHCWKCHGPEKHKGGLRLDSEEGLAKGGDTGPAVVSGKPDESLLIQAVRYQSDLKMPPKGKLSDAEVADLVDWVRAGAEWPGVAKLKPSPAPSRSSTAPEGTGLFWAFQPLRGPKPPDVQSGTGSQSPVDRYILSALERKGLTSAPPAEKAILIRRATFDLTGLPPSPEEVGAFLADTSPDAFAKVVDRLLASPRYGERWGRHWLDLARYADSNGMDENVAYANAFRYRDYVIRAFNIDKPYDQFLKEQIAGDLMPRSNDETVNQERLVATGFLVLGPKMLAEDDPVKMEMDIIDEQVDTVGRVFMGLTLGCARCHDHKFDPIPTTDYYGLAGIFKSTRTMENHKVVAMWHEHPIATESEKAATETFRKAVATRKAEIKALVEQARTAAKGDDRAKLDEELRRKRKSLADFEKQAPPISAIMSVEDQEAADIRVHIRGSHLTLGQEVPRRFPTVLAGPNGTVVDKARSGRLELGDWLTRPDHPLTARVMVNRIWLGHFGEGIVRSPDNFGRLGEAPDHPELLDWLARRFVESGWSVKAMHRLIMLTSTYQKSTHQDVRSAQVDPENRLLSHFSRRRLEAEAIRDAILAVSGELDATMGGSLLPTKNHGYVNNTGGAGSVKYDVNRRSVYLPVIRSGLYDVFQAFDFADPSTSNGKRIPTTVAPQALFMMNDRLVLRCSDAMAGRLLARTDLDTSRRIELAFQRAYGRPAIKREIDRAEDYLRRFDDELAAEGVAPEARPRRAWQLLCQAIFSSSEFLYLE